MGPLLPLARNFPDSVRHQELAHCGQQEIWDQPQRLTELNAQVLLIVGYGSIGRELARRATAFDMRVWGVTRSGQGDTTYAEKIVPVSELHQMLPHADFVVIAALETPETRHLIGAAELARMKPSARVVIVSRGSLLDEMAPVQALKEPRPGGAALDVTAIEPLAPESPLWKTPHLMITPYTSAVSDRLWKRQTESQAELLERWFGGRELFNRFREAFRPRGAGAGQSPTPPLGAVYPSLA